jgi:hypothetical protein
MTDDLSDETLECDVMPLHNITLSGLCTAWEPLISIGVRWEPELEPHLAPGGWRSLHRRPTWGQVAEWILYVAVASKGVQLVLWAALLAMGKAEGCSAVKGPGAR